MRLIHYYTLAGVCVLIAIPFAVEDYREGKQRFEESEQRLAKSKEFLKVCEEEVIAVEYNLSEVRRQHAKWVHERESIAAAQQHEGKAAPLIEGLHQRNVKAGQRNVEVADQVEEVAQQIAEGAQKTVNTARMLVKSAETSRELSKHYVRDFYSTNLVALYLVAFFLYLAHTQVRAKSKDVAGEKLTSPS